MPTRNLTHTEITTLEQRGCRAEQWEQIRVAQEFTPGDSFRRVHFSGDVCLGVFIGDVDIGDGIFLPAGVTNSKLHNVTIGDNCRIDACTLANVNVGDDSILDHVSELSCESASSFGNNQPANVLTEDGARSIPVWRHLSSQLAHILCHCKNQPAAAALENIIAKDVRDLTGGRSHVGHGCLLRRTGRLRNVWFGDGAVAEGVGDLHECFIEGGAAAAWLGESVSAEGCVFLSASRTEGGVRLEHCLVGEGVKLEQALYAEHSVFFANSFFKLGEAISVMAGPFAESHHKATLVLTCQCSFGTFGSGTNASNHHFKLGPRHGGVLRRGTRCGSGSYLYWPCDIGAFSTVVGRHTEHLETVDFPFSLIVSTGAGSVLVPGVHVFSIGVFRDGIKWQQRDRRGSIRRPLDLVNTAVYSPYTMQAIEEGLSLLRRSESMEGDLRHGGAVIPAQRVQPAIRLYESVLQYYVGECLARYLTEKYPDRRLSAGLVADAIEEATSLSVGFVGGVWRDWGGMLVCGSDADEFLSDLAERRLTDQDQVRRRLESIHREYHHREFEWVARRWRRDNGEVTVEGVSAFYAAWRKVAVQRAESLIKDAGKEFTPELVYGFGVESDAQESFRRIRGEAADEPVVREVLREREYLLELTRLI